MHDLPETHERGDCYRILDGPPTPNAVNSLEISENRTKTDNLFLKVFGVCVVLLLPGVIYTLCHSDINRLKGYDECGNICGQDNVRDYRWSCTGQDMTLKPMYYLDECRDRYGSEIKLYSKSMDSWSINTETIFNFLHRAAWKVVLVSLVPVALCLISIALFRYVPRVAVWSILILSWIFFTSLLIVLSIGTGFFLLPLSILLIIKLWVLFFNRSKIKSVTLLLKEATRALFEVKMMSYISIGALPVLIVILLIYTIITFYIMTAGKLTEQWSNRIIYSFDNLMLTTVIIGSIVTFWAGQFVAGIQDMIVSGTIAKWYTTKNQDHLLDEAVPSTLQVTVNYHLGTIALGSGVKTVMFIPRLVLGFLEHITGANDRMIRCINGFFTNKIYIATAVYGTSFIQSGKTLVKVLKLSNGNTEDVVAFGNMVIMLGQILVISISTLLAYVTIYFATGSYYTYSLYYALIEFGIAAICSHTILGTIKVSANTLFFCATEELLKNKEDDMPLTMSKKEFFDRSSKVFLQKVQSRPMSIIPEKSFYIKLFLVVFVCISFASFIVAYFI